MKRLFFFVFILSALFGSSHAQLNTWRWQNPLPAGNYLRAVQMISLTTVYISGDGGNVMKSTDGGDSWTLQNSILGIKANFNCLSFLDENYGFCAGDSGRMIRTADGGSTWQLIDAKTSVKINGILDVDKNVVLAVNHVGNILRSVDGGTTWTTVATEGYPELFSIRMLRPNFITIAGANGTLIKSTDEGMTWSPIQTNVGNNFYSADFIDDSTATVTGDNGTIIHTTNGGILWTKQALPDSLAITATLNVVDGKDPNIFAIAGDHATLLYTTDGGITWQQSYLVGTLDPVKGLSFINKTTGIAAGKNGLVLRTTDGGVTWTFLPHKAYTELLHSIAFPKGDTSLGLAVGNNGAIMRTSDGGKNWGVIDNAFSHILYSVCFLDEVHAIAVGEYGTILKSLDSGLTWTPLVSGTTHHLYSVSFSTPKAGVVVGDSATILTTLTGGEFWTSRWTTPLTGDYFNSVSSPDSLHAFLCGANAVYKTTDGGISWFPAPGAAYSRGQSISFGDSLHGGFCYEDKFGIGYTRSTSDGGVTFDSTYPDLNGHNLFGICFSDRQHATVVGAFGDIYHSTNNGASWFAQNSNTTNTLYAVAFGTINAGNAVGVHGNIVRITSDDKLAVRTLSPAADRKIIIEASYPNPASTLTTIKYYLPLSEYTSAALFTIDGKQISSLVSEFQSSGEHVIHFDAAGFSSGAYIIRITSGLSTASGEIIVSH
jgi:photosystem II stability/assembly factor-like uncharacterized protein